MVEAWYVTREDVTSALDVTESPRDNALIDSAIGAATQTVFGKLHRVFYPSLGTRLFDWPNPSSRSAYRLWLDDNDLISASAVVSGGVALTTGQYIPRRADSHTDGPFTYVEINLGTSGAWSAGPTFQQSIGITGLWGHSTTEDQIGELSAPLSASASATAQLTWSTMDFGVGSILRIDSEYMIITARSMRDTTQDTTTVLDEDYSDNVAGVADGTAFAVDEILLLGSERMQIVDIAGNNLIVKRGIDGTVLASHPIGTDVYARTGATLARAQLGSTLAAHSSAAPVLRHKAPSLVRELTLAYAETDLIQKRSAWGRTIGEGENLRESSGRGLSQILADARATFGRKLRHRAVI